MTYRGHGGYNPPMPSFRIVPNHVRATPPGGWKFIVPESMSVRLKGVKVEGPTLEQLRKNVTRLFINNGEPFRNEAFESELCSYLPPEYCQTCGDKGIEWREYEPMSARKVLSFFATMVLWYRQGHRFVSSEEARRRYDICRNCPRATDVPPPGLDKEGCVTCGAEGAGRKFLKEKTQNLVDLSGGRPPLYCTLCGCDLTVKAHFDIDSDCWKKNS